MFSLTDLVPIIVIAVIVAFSRIQIQEQKDIFSVENSMILRGLMAINVVLCHFSHYYGNGIILPVFTALGNLAVGIFFFLSGFGLMKQYLNRPDYRKTFFRKRILKVIVPYMIFTVLYWLYYTLIGKTYGLKDVILKLFTDEPLVTYSWYLVEIIVLYLFFWLFMHLIKTEKRYMILLNLISYLVLFAFYKSRNYVSYCYYSTHMFAIGIIWATYEEKINTFIQKYGKYLIVPSAAIIVVFFRNTPFYPLTEIAFLLLIAVFFSHFSYQNRFLSYIGRISMEKYLIHGLMIMIFRRLFMDSVSFTAAFLLFILICISSCLMHMILSFCFNRKRK